MFEKIHNVQTFFFFYVEEIRTDTEPLLGGGGKWRGSAGLQPTKISTMTDSAAIEGFDTRSLWKFWN